MRPGMGRDAMQRIQSAYGGKYDFERFTSSKRDIAAALGEEYQSQQKQSVGRCFGRDRGVLIARHGRNGAEIMGMSDEVSFMLNFYSSRLYSSTSDTVQSSIKHRVSSVLVLMGLPCYMRCSTAGKKNI